jgi:hypothetical protein
VNSVAKTKKLRTMNNELKNDGFSLMEVLLAVGTLAIGMIFVGGTFLTGVYFSTIATERTIAAVAADEAFAKIKLYGNADESWSVSDECKNFGELVSIDANEFAYPSTPNDIAGKQYFWSALCRRVGNAPNRLVQVTVFVSRRAGSATKYRNPLDPINGTVGYPMPVKVSVSATGNANEIRIEDVPPIDGIEYTFINDGYTIVENTTGNIYRVIKRYAKQPAEQPNTILLDRPWNLHGRYPEPDDFVWVVPPPSGGRYPCIAVYQKVIGF